MALLAQIEKKPSKGVHNQSGHARSNMFVVRVHWVFLQFLRVSENNLPIVAIKQMLLLLGEGVLFLIVLDLAKNRAFLALDHGDAGSWWC